jgi:hypothetical protein
MNIKTVVTGLLAVFTLALAPAAYAADNGTEFGIEDDLSVLGTEGTALDPDAEIKGFTVFGATQAAYTGAVVGAGNVVVNGHLAVSSGAYFVGGSTFAAGGAYFTGVSSFSNVANLHIAGGTVNQVLKKVPGGGMVWGDDNTGLASLGDPRRLQMVNDTDDGLINSVFLQNALDTNITMLATSSMTILGAFEAGGAVALRDNLAVTGITSLNGIINLGDGAGDLVTMMAPLTVMGTSSITVQGALEVDGAAKLDGSVTLGDAAADLLTVNAQSSFVGGSTFTAGAYFQSISSFSSAANIHVAGGTVNQVLKKVPGGGMVWGDDNTGLTSLGTPRRLQMVNDTDDGLIDSVFQQNALDTNITMLATSSMTVLGAFGAGGAVELGNTLTVAENAQLGNTTSDTHSVNRAPEAGVALSVNSGGASGNYAAKFYSNGSLAAWLKKK